MPRAEERQLTAAEKRAVDRLERALAAIPDTLALHFNEGGFNVFDRDDFGRTAEDRHFWKYELDSRSIDCRYDTGAL